MCPCIRHQEFSSQKKKYVYVKLRIIGCDVSQTQYSFSQGVETRVLESHVRIMLNSICITHDEALSGWSWSLGCLDRVTLPLQLQGVKTSGIVLIVCDLKTSQKSVERLPLIAVSAGAEAPWPGLLKACVLWFPSLSVSSPELLSNVSN